MEMGDDLTLRLGLDLHGDARAPSVARHVVHACLSATGVEDVDSLDVITSELVTNAVVHAGGDVEVDVTVRVDGAVHIGVVDGGHGWPEAVRRPIEAQLDPAAGSREPSGLGLQLVDALATTWGCQPRDGPGKRVWAEARPRASGR